MAEFKIDAAVRIVKGKKVGKLRREGVVPGTIYGPAVEPMSVQFPYRPLEVALLKAGGTNIIDIAVDETAYPVVARDVQRDIMTGNILHVDFYAVDMNSTIRAEIPVQLIGESSVVTSREGILITGPNTITVEVLPGDLINEIEVDLSGLDELGDGVTVADLDLGDKITIINDPDEMLAKVVQSSAARALEELERLDALGEEGLEGEEGEEGVEGEEGEGGDTGEDAE